MTFQHFHLDNCATVASWKFCKFSSHFGERVLAVLVLSTIYAVARRNHLTELFHAIQAPGPLGAPMIAAAGGLLLAVIPAVVVGPDAEGSALLAALVAWASGVVLASGAALRLLAPWPVWLRTFQSGRLLLPILVIVALALPELGDLLFPLWHLDIIRDFTFSAVVWMSGQMGLQLVHEAGYVLRDGSFAVEVGQSCSGVEGFVLTSVFLGGYATLFWRQLSLWRVLSILPLALALSWLLNVFRISLLIWIGVNVSPTLAVEGFHSHAGWLLFSGLALLMIGVVHTIPWFRSERIKTSSHMDRASADAPLPPLVQDWNVARILPFAVFMFSALVASTFFQHPVLAYPIRLLLMLAILWVFRTHLLALPWRLDFQAMAMGAGIGAIWLVTAPSDAGADLAPALTGLGSGVFILWIIARSIGTSLAVPVIEELFFRSYLLDLLGAQQSIGRTILAVAISTAAFAVLHDRWLAAALAGLVFAWLALRRDGRLTDAILCHMVANALIAAAAIIEGNWGLL
ncbi:exosortase E/protease, VPEID-CTERM system [Ruegeria sp. 2012CJ41-6]|uniref:Exosortase E/protease, VPEID-CTERM system n=2 Tax=Ruegeria spongiae TaxID=2942209 RepID=A0ABT0Q5T3_9RHOB|nr:exosortase E/protease, VPEID-CTERM system [Ruegeria spongiae]